MNILLTILCSALACCIIGNFLVLRNMSMTADALSHSVLLGIVIAYFFTRNLSSYWLLISATLIGVLTVVLVEFLANKAKFKKHDALGFVFPLFFSISIIIIARFFRNAPLSIDTVLMGNPIVAVFNTYLGIPKIVWVLFPILLLNLIFIIIYYKQLKVSSFDNEFAILKGIKTKFIFYILMTLCSVTIIASFEAVGAILVIAFIVIPPASAYLISKNLLMMIFLSLFFTLITTILGYNLSFIYNISISGTVAFLSFLILLIIILINPKGIIYRLIERRATKKRLYDNILMVHLANHLNNPNERSFDQIDKHLKWSKQQIRLRINKLIEEGYVIKNEKIRVYDLSLKGLKHVRILLEK